MSGLRGVFAGVLALVALQAVVATEASSKRVKRLFGDTTGLIERALSPAVPAIPDRRGGIAFDDELVDATQLEDLRSYRRPKTPAPPETAPPGRVWRNR